MKKVRFARITFGIHRLDFTYRNGMASFIAYRHRMPLGPYALLHWF